MHAEAMLTRDEAAARLGVKPQTLAHWMKRRPGYLPAVKVGNRIRYDRAVVEAFIQRQTVGNTEENHD